MDQRTLQMIQRGLIAAVSLVLALIVITSFRGLLEPAGETIPRRTTTTIAAGAGDDTSTTTTTTTTAAATGDTTTSAPVSTDDCTDQRPSSDNATLLQVYFPCGSSSFAVGSFVYRSVPKTDLVLTTTMKEMTKGVEPEEQAVGFRSPFPDSADGSFLGVSLDSGTAYVEFSVGIFPDGADTAEGSQIFLSTLNANVFQFDTINAVEYRLAGSCSAFFQQLGAECETITRAEWLSQRASP
jgi:hypothetical protein